MTATDAIVIGGGHSGLSMSYILKQQGLPHLVFEENRIGNSWIFQRWDSFKFNTPNITNHLPGWENDYSDPEGFCTAKEFVTNMVHYARSQDLPVKEKARVISVTQAPGSALFSVVVLIGGKQEKFSSKVVVVASGSQNRKLIPGFASSLSREIFQVHAADYRNEKQLPQGDILVVGSGQSGVQIAEDLVDSGRRVYLSTSKVARGPRRYRGKDIMVWLNMIGFFDQRPQDLPDPQMMRMKQPQISGVGPRGRTVSLQSLAKKGVVILGKVKTGSGLQLEIEPNAGEHVKFGDTFSNIIKGFVDEYIQKTRLEAPPAEIDPADIPDETASCVCNETQVNLSRCNISSIIWATGFKGDYSYLGLPVFTEENAPKHQNGISEIDGLFFMGLNWMRKRKSAIVLGAEEDASFIGNEISKIV